jgi:spore maturation protein SpmA
MLNGLWLGFFVVAAVSAFGRWLIGDDAAVFAAMVESLFAMARLSVEVMILLFGTLTLWLGFLRIAEKAGIVDMLARLLSPLFRRLMTDVPAGHPALGFITLNFTASRSAMMPDPTTTASSMAVPKPSATRRRTIAMLLSRRVL